MFLSLERMVFIMFNAKAIFYPNRCEISVFDHAVFSHQRKQKRNSYVQSTPFGDMVPIYDFDTELYQNYREEVMRCSISRTKKNIRRIALSYSNRAYFATFTRFLKFCAFFISILLPGIYVALGTFNPEMFPTLMLNKIAGSISATPLSLMYETILIQLVYEIMREAGLRMPQPLGYAVSIVGGLVVGDTAINAGLIGAPTLMVVAITAICSYVIPNLYAPSSVLRIVFTFDFFTS